MCITLNAHHHIKITIITMLALLARQSQFPFGVWQALKSYQGSNAQAHLHTYLRNEQLLKETKQTIDYKTINKNSKGRFMIREFLFQEKIAQNYVAPLDCYLLPIGKWTRDEIKEHLISIVETATERENQNILQDCQSTFEGVLRDYYNRSGKRGYKFILSEQIGKISRMSEPEFTAFVKVLGGNQQEILRTMVAPRK